MKIEYKDVEEWKPEQTRLSTYPREVPFDQLTISLINTKTGEEIPISELHYGPPPGAANRTM